MHKLTKAYGEMLETNPLLKGMVLVAKSFDHRLVTREHTYLSFKSQLKTKEAQKGDIPGWFKYFEMEKTPPLHEMLREMLEDPLVAQESASELIGWLRRVDYTTCAYSAQINDETIMKLSIGHPISFWIRDHEDDLHACCDVGMILCRYIHPTPKDIQKSDIPDCLIDIPVQLDLFRIKILPQMNAFRERALINCNKDYLSLFFPDANNDEVEEKEDKQ